MHVFSNAYETASCYSCPVPLRFFLFFYLGIVSSLWTGIHSYKLGILFHSSCGCFFQCLWNWLLLYFFPSAYKIASSYIFFLGIASILGTGIHSFTFRILSRLSCACCQAKVWRLIMFGRLLRVCVGLRVTVYISVCVCMVMYVYIYIYACMHVCVCIPAGIWARAFCPHQSSALKYALLALCFYVLVKSVRCCV